MKLNHTKFFNIRLLTLALFLFLGTGTAVWAQEADTSMADIEFTEITPETTPASADTAAVAPANTTKDSKQRYYCR